jgi:hypothetical protein
VQPRRYIHQRLHQIREIKNQTVKQIAGVLAQKLSIKEQKRRIVYCKGQTRDYFSKAARGTITITTNFAYN